MKKYFFTLFLVLHSIHSGAFASSSALDHPLVMGIISNLLIETHWQANAVCLLHGVLGFSEETVGRAAIGYILGTVIGRQARPLIKEAFANIRQLNKSCPE